MQKILSIYPNPTNINPDGVTGTLFFPNQSRQKNETATLKVDHKISQKNMLSGRYNFQWFNDPNPGFDELFPVSGVQSFGATSAFAKNQILTLTLTSSPTPTMVNQLLVSANRSTNGSHCDGINFFNSLGLVDNLGNGADYVLPNVSGFGCVNLFEASQQIIAQGTDQYKDTLTKVIRTHELKFGAETRRVYSNNQTNFNQREEYFFDTLTDSGLSPLQNLQPNVLNNELGDLSSALLGFVDFKRGTQFLTRNGSRVATDERDFRQPEYGFFGQDTWKVRPDLTLTYGLRWDYYTVPYETNGLVTNIFQNPSGPGPFTFVPVGPGTGHQLYNNYYRDFQPRFGFAWDPFKDGKTSVRGGIGAFTDRVFGNESENPRFNPPFEPSSSSFVAFNNGLTAAAQLSNQATPPTLPLNPVVGNGSLLFPDIFVPNIRPPMVYSWNFGIQRELEKDLTLEVNYVGNHATRILMFVDGNPPQPALVAQQLASGVPPQDLQFGSLLTLATMNNTAFDYAFENETEGWSRYQGLQVSLIQHRWHGLQAQLSYTWSHAFDDTEDPIGNGDSIGSEFGEAPDPFNFKHEFGNSPYDTRQRAVLNFVYHPAIGRGSGLLSHGVAGRVFEGWQIGAIASFQTGLPYSVTGQVDTLHTTVADRATLIDPAVLKTIPSTGKFLPGSTEVFTGENPAAFNLASASNGYAGAPFGILSNTIRNQFYGPGTNNWDFSFSKVTGITERMKFEFRIESYNLFNRVQFAKPDNFIGDAGNTFGYSSQQIGQPDGTTGARQFQIVGKITF